MLKRITGIIALRSAQHYLQWITKAERETEATADSNEVVIEEFCRGLCSMLPTDVWYLYLKHTHSCTRPLFQCFSGKKQSWADRESLAKGGNMIPGQAAFTV